MATSVDPVFMYPTHTLLTAPNCDVCSSSSSPSSKSPDNKGVADAAHNQKAFRPHSVTTEGRFFTITPPLPSGLRFDGETGEISGAAAAGAKLQVHVIQMVCKESQNVVAETRLAVESLEDASILFEIFIMVSCLVLVLLIGIVTWRSIKGTQSLALQDRPQLSHTFTPTRTHA